MFPPLSGVRCKRKGSRRVHNTLFIPGCWPVWVVTALSVEVSGSFYIGGTASRMRLGTPVEDVTVRLDGYVGNITIQSITKHIS